jgi:hypothetical protein
MFGRDRRRIDAEIEERGRNGSATLEDQLRLDTATPWPVEGRHQRAVEEDQRRRTALPCELNTSRTAGVRSKDNDTDLPCAFSVTESSIPL